MATTLKRTQMYLSEDMLEQVRRVADSEHTTIAEIVRNAVDEFLKKKKKKEVNWDNDPLWDMVGQAGSSGSSDVSVNHDAYLYGGKQ